MSIRVSICWSLQPIRIRAERQHQRAQALVHQAVANEHREFRDARSETTAFYTDRVIHPIHRCEKNELHLIIEDA